MKYIRYLSKVNREIQEEMNVVGKCYRPLFILLVASCFAFLLCLFVLSAMYEKKNKFYNNVYLADNNRVFIINHHVQFDSTKSVTNNTINMFNITNTRTAAAIIKSAGNKLITTKSETETRMKTVMNASITTTISEKRNLNYCPSVPPGLVGSINVSKTPILNITELEKDYSWLQKGGQYSPPCIQNQTVAIIVPYRGRSEHLTLFLKHIHPFLKKQQRDYTIYIIEQNDTLPFNRGQLLNIGYLEAMKERNFTCFILHDVDLFPENDRLLYNCSDQAVHMISALNKWNYTMLYKYCFGGVVSMSSKVYKEMNGFSNRFWGWGGEDEDFKNRLSSNGRNFIRPVGEIGRYTMLEHDQETSNPKRWRILKNGARSLMSDGVLNINYTIKSIDKYLLFTRILVKLHTPMKKTP